MNHYPALLTVHLFAALIFAGSVFFEVLILEGVRKKVPDNVMDTVEHAIVARARWIMPWVLLCLYGSGLSMVFLNYLPLLAHPLAASFSILLMIKIILAFSILGHFCTAMFLFATKRMNAVYFKFIHLSVFSHMVVLIFLAKAMFYWSW